MPKYLWSARGEVREIVPRPPQMVDNAINRRIRNALDTRIWSDTMKIGMIILPNATNTGTVTFTQGSNIVNGTGTTWPVSDYINTTIASAIPDAPGFVEITPGVGVIGKIKPGMFLLLDQAGGPIAEIITAVSVGPVTFTAYCQFPHAANATLTVSSLAGQQLQSAAYLYTVKAVLSPTQLQQDLPFGGLPQANTSYTIMQQYVMISPTARALNYAWDAIAGQPLGILRDYNWVTAVDPQRQSTGDPQELASMPPNPGGFMQWEVWPPASTQYAIGVLYQDGWPELKYDTDVLPPFMNPQIFIAGATADCLRTKVLKNDRDKDPYYDLAASQIWQRDHDQLLEMATQFDQFRSLTYLQNYREAMCEYSYNWLRSHAIGGDAGWGGYCC